MFCSSFNILNEPIEVNCSFIFGRYIFIGQILSFITGILVNLQARRIKSSHIFHFLKECCFARMG